MAHQETVSRSKFINTTFTKYFLLSFCHEEGKEQGAIRGKHGTEWLKSTGKAIMELRDQTVGAASCLAQGSVGEILWPCSWLCTTPKQGRGSGSMREGFEIPFQG
jgi:hypothetical protein